MAKLRLGTREITPVIEVGAEKVYNVDGYDWLGEVNAQGELVAPTDINVVFNDVKEITTSVLRYKFDGNPGLKTISFPDLDTLGNRSLYRLCYNCSNLTTIYFNSLTSNSFGEYTNCFEIMLRYCSNVTVHFPVGLDATIGSWSDVLAGFGGTNTIILYDL